MNVSFIIIVILIMILISILYIYYYSNKNNLNSYLDLSKTNPAIQSTLLVNNTSNKFSYSFWLFITSPNATDTKGSTSYFITRTSEISIGFGKDLYVKCLNAASPLNIVVYKDVPSQKWIHVIINRSSDLLECYINGKLNMSKNIDSTSQITTNNIIISIANAYISKFQRWEKPITPSEASNMYYSGNGYSNIFPNINVVASVLENDVVQKQYSIF